MFMLVCNLSIDIQVVQNSQNVLFGELLYFLEEFEAYPITARSLPCVAFFLLLLAFRPWLLALPVPHLLPVGLSVGCSQLCVSHVHHHRYMVVLTAHVLCEDE
jgi:uncharacterized membrane protein (DUF485 family)